MINTSDDSDLRFSNLELDLPSNARQVIPVIPPAHKPATLGAPPKVDLRAGEIDLDGAARAMADEANARRAGFAPKPPIYQIGSRVNELGVENFKASRQSWADMASVPDACRTLANQIAAERREDLLVNVPDLRLTATGALRTPDGHLLAVSERALDGFARLVTPGGAAYLTQCPAFLRAENLNHWFAHGFRKDARASKDAARDVYAAQQVTLRTRAARDGSGGREVFAAVGPRYAPSDIDGVATLAQEAFGGDARADITYDGFKASIDVLFHSNINPKSAVAGEIFKCGVRLKAADDGSGSIQTKLVLWRNLCLNLIVIDFNQILVGRRKHVGSTAGIIADVREFMADANARIQLVANKWDECSSENILERYDLQDSDQVIRGLVLNKVVHVPGVPAEEMIDRLTRAWQVEMGYTKADYLNAITRAAHTEEWARWSDAEDLESTAGALMFQKVWNCRPPVERTAEDILA